MPVSRYRYQIYVKSGGGWKAYYGTDNRTQWIAVQYGLRRRGVTFKTKTK